MSFENHAYLDNHSKMSTKRGLTEQISPKYLPTVQILSSFLFIYF